MINEIVTIISSMNTHRYCFSREQAHREDRTCFDTELMTEQAQSPAYKILHQASFPGRDRF